MVLREQRWSSRWIADARILCDTSVIQRNNVTVNSLKKGNSTELMAIVALGDVSSYFSHCMISKQIAIEQYLGCTIHFIIIKQFGEDVL